MSPSWASATGSTVSLALRRIHEALPTTTAKASTASAALPPTRSTTT
jgi:Flp pilus assembly protein CpaB